MPPVRMAAVASLVMAALLSILSGVPSTGLDTVAPAMMLIAMLVVTANAGGVLWLTRRGAVDGAGLWLVLVGVAFALALVASPLWMGLFVSPAKDLSEVIDAIAATSAVIQWVMGLGAAALAAGWGLWALSVVRSRRAAA